MVISSCECGEAPSLILAAAAELMVGHFFIIDYNDQHINLQFAALGFGGVRSAASRRAGGRWAGDASYLECGRLSCYLAVKDVHQRRVAADD